MSGFLHTVAKDYTPSKHENVLSSIFDQYENVIVQSIVTSFGLDFLIKDHLGGDVDTIRNVRKDIYQKEEYRQAYENRGEYNSAAYHKDTRYIAKNKQISEQRKNGELYDAYTGELIARNGKPDLDHVISAKEIHDDRGRVLAGLNGVDLANSDSNLKATNPHTNRTKKASSMDDFLDKYGDEYTEAQKAQMRSLDRKSRAAYEAEIAKSYYTSKQFAKDTAKAAGKLGAKMGLRQAIGLIFTEIWFSIKAEFERFNLHFGLHMDLGDFFRAIGNGVRNGYDSAKQKYKEIFGMFIKGSEAGFISSLTVTICNIFFTTAKNTVKIIRESIAAIIEATKILLFNPDCLPFGERMRAALKVLAAGASIVAGSLVAEALNATPVGSIPEIGGIINTFCGTFVTGIFSCTLLYYLDRSPLINKIVQMLNRIPSIENQILYYKQQAEAFEKYAAELMKIDLDQFQKETEAFSSVAKAIDTAKSDNELNQILQSTFKRIGIAMPWHNYNSLDDLMNDPNGVMMFQ